MGERRLDIAQGNAMWSHPGKRVSIRWMLVRDVTGLLEPQAFLCTDEKLQCEDVLRLFVRRWSVEEAFAEVRRHLWIQRISSTSRTDRDMIKIPRDLHERLIEAVCYPA